MLSVECCVVFYCDRKYHQGRGPAGMETEPNLFSTIAKVNTIFEQGFVSPTLSFADRLLP